MLRYVLQRALLMAISLVTASFIIFAVVQLLPGDVAQMILGQFATPETLAELRHTLKLNDPFLVRYLHWVVGVLHGDLGTSLSITGYPVADLLTARAANSVFLAVCAAVVVGPVALVMGTTAALRRDTWLDRTITLTSMVAISLPEFATGVFLILLFSLGLGWLPSMSSIDPTQSLFSQISMLVLPILTLSLALLGYVAKMVRASVLEVAASPYVRTATLNGLPRSTVTVKYILRNALLPAITVFAMSVGWMIGGLVVVETVFAYPGLGSLLLYSIMQRDVPLIQSVTLVVVAVYMILNGLADLSYMFLNPSIRQQQTR